MRSKLTRQIYLFAALLWTISVYGQLDTIVAQKDPLALSYLSRARELQFTDSDSSIILFKMSYDRQISNHDTLNAIYSLVKLADLHSHKANFEESYDAYWQALLMADMINDARAKAMSYEGLGWLYSLYKRKEKAVDYFNLCIELRKPELAKGNLEASGLVDCYYALAVLYRKEKNTQMSRQYLDSCELVKKQRPVNRVASSAYRNAELGYITYYDEEYEKALAILIKVEPFFIDNHKPYLVILHSFIAKISQAVEEPELSEEYYLRAIETSKKFQSHLDLIPEIHENLAALYIDIGEAEKAYYHLGLAKTLDDKHFGARSKENSKFLEIKDQFRLEKEIQDDLLREQKVAELEYKSQISQVRNLLLLSTLLFLIILGFFIYRFLRLRYKAEKRLLKEQEKMKMEKASELMIAKNQELTKSTLQVIEVEELLSSVKAKLIEQKKDPKPQDIHKLIKKIDTNMSKNWKEFEARFISVNRSFYEGLLSAHPNLNQSEQRLCALVKLDFSSKDMSRLLGISVASVHTSRYRLRKKLGLAKNSNLKDFISKF